MVMGQLAHIAIMDIKCNWFSFQHITLNWVNVQVVVSICTGRFLFIFNMQDYCTYLLLENMYCVNISFILNFSISVLPRRVKPSGYVTTCECNTQADSCMSCI